MGVIAVAALTAACTTPPVPPVQPSVPLTRSFLHAVPSGAAAAAPDADWWSAYGDARLSGFIEEALKSNQDVGIALQRVRQVQAGLKSQEARLWPSVGLQLSASRTDTGLSDAVKQGLPDTRALRAGLEVAWEIDLAGGVRAARDAAQAEALAAMLGVDGARLLVASEVGRQYFLVRAAQEQLRIVQSLAATQRETADRVASRAREGQASAFDLDRARAEANDLDAQVPLLRLQAGIADSRLAVLLGRQPSARVIDPDQPFVWPAPRIMAPGQPGDLLKRRPDLVAAEARVSAEGLRSAEARAQWWPKLFLNALVGRQDLRLNALDLAPARFSNVALAFAMPLFNAGRIDAGVEAQSARTQEALLVWQKAILVAVQEVEDSLLMQEQQAWRLRALAQTVDHRQRSLQRAQALQREGQIDLLVLLDVQRSVLASELALSDSRLQQALADVQLYKALGGGLPSLAADGAPQSLAARTSK